MQEKQLFESAKNELAEKVTQLQQLQLTISQSEHTSKCATKKIYEGIVPDIEQREAATKQVKEYKEQEKKIIQEIVPLQARAVDLALTLLNKINLADTQEVESLWIDKTFILALLDTIEPTNIYDPVLKSTLESNIYLLLKEIYQFDVFTFNKLTINALQSIAEMTNKTNFNFSVLNFKYLPENTDVNALAKLTKRVYEIQFSTPPNSQFINAFKQAREKNGVDFKVSAISFQNITIDKEFEVNEFFNVGVRFLKLNHVTLMPSAYPYFKKMQSVEGLYLTQIKFTHPETSQEFWDNIYYLLNQTNPQFIFIDNIEVKQKYNNAVALLNKLKEGKFDQVTIEKINAIKNDNKSLAFPIFLELQKQIDNQLISLLAEVTEFSDLAYKNLCANVIVYQYPNEQKEKEFRKLLDKNIFDIDYYAYSKDSYPRKFTLSENFFHLLTLKNFIHRFKLDISESYELKIKLANNLDIIEKLFNAKYLSEQESLSLKENIKGVCIESINHLLRDNTRDSFTMAFFIAREYCNSESRRVDIAFAKFLLSELSTNMDPKFYISYVYEMKSLIKKIRGEDELSSLQDDCIAALIFIAHNFNFKTLPTLKANELNKLSDLLIKSLRKVPASSRHYEGAMDCLIGIFKRKITFVLENTNNSHFENLQKNISATTNLPALKKFLDNEFNQFSLGKTVNSIFHGNSVDALKEIHAQLNELLERLIPYSRLTLTAPLSPPVKKDSLSISISKSLSNILRLGHKADAVAESSESHTKVYKKLG